MKRLWQAGSLLLALSLSVMAEDNAIQLPELGSANRASFSQQQEDILSLAFLEALYQQADIVSDPEVNDYVRGIGARLLRYTHSNRQFQFYVIKDDSINAFAGPGGIIAIHSGLILAAKTEDELAAVMAHEIEHVQQEHLSRMFAEGKKGMLPMVAGIVGALLVGSRSPQAAMAMITGGIAYNAQQQLAFSRDNEWEADRFGIDILHAAGYDPNAMADFFETLASRYRNDGNTPEILMSHPVTDKRISDSRARARTLRHTAKISNTSLQLAQIRLKQLLGKPQTTTSPQQACYLQQITYSLERGVHPPPTCTLLPEHLLSHLVLLQNKTQLNNEAWQALIDLYPHNSAIILRYADALMEADQAQKTIDLLTPLTSTFNEHWALWEPIARAWNRIGDTANEAYAMAQAYSSIGDLKLAKIQSDRAKKSTETSSQLALKQQIDTLNSWILLQEKLRKEL